MSAKILEGAVGKVADRWLPNILGSPLLFWVGVFLLYVYSRDDDWDSVVGWFSKLPDTSQIIAIGLVVCLTIASDLAIQQLEFPILRLLEGYWPHWKLLARGRRWLISKINARQKRIRAELTEITKNEILKQIKPGDFEKRSRLEAQRAKLPINFQNDAVNRYLMPTRLGNVLRTYERKPSEKYGLDAIVCWPRLWLLLPDSVKADLGEARMDLNAATRLWIWNVLLSLVSGAFILQEQTHGWVALGVGVAGAALTYYTWMLSAAQTYGILIDSTFDTYRHLLYEALRIPLPETSAAEPSCGQQLTDYLLGSQTGSLKFAQPPAD